MNRREFLECAAILVSGSAANSSCFALSAEQSAYLAASPDYISQEVSLFSASQHRTIAAMSEIIIPTTDTPGAIEAGVPRFIELMVADWMNEQERRGFMFGLEAMEKATCEDFSTAFYELHSQQQLSILEQMERAAMDSPWYQPGNVRRAFISDAPFICMVKELTIWGFFTSKIGASEVLRYNAMPMRFDGHLPLAPGDSSWAPYMFI